ncbi:Putative N2,N2-dimethylguanosine tRNA methyltransferase [Plasmopara halstedii]|uniref:Putative N2,N2-dimethylguanosine tRNA methyltransferase n=1 Tax=Plasmopara halstedii TaxID=4781 RepID=A0A0P1B6G4_PLAHL|nr:Putative N2,N2-dimethylguanosine tRNA methyltransferase [Plasmopara halstedii]CEG50389.1 Putative N2,N2-dimethylguanosine tRNA methyltransferase [Plasmopara halstedii]|eukprot:XP_024586758.1 Putative N2,N2-dimethylguanosine tRNA methyltransferase [Plasmopara halstedii]
MSTLEVFPEENVNKVEETIRVRVNGKDLNLTLVMQADELAPLFSGAAWAGTLLWDAAVHLTRRFLHDYHHILQDPHNLLCVLELGAGIGVPGMAARIAGAHHVVLTEQNELLRLMRVNLAANAAVLNLSHNHETKGGIVARPLSWGVSETKEYLTRYATEKIDVVLSCDCIYEPLYGKSWQALAQTMEMLCLANHATVVLMAVERRNKDGVENFLTFVDTQTQLQYRLEEQTVVKKMIQLEVYYLRLKDKLRV